jgi:hypothetical protein
MGTRVSDVVSVIYAGQVPFACTDNPETVVAVYAFPTIDIIVEEGRQQGAE